MQAGNELLNILSKSLHARKKLPPPPKYLSLNHPFYQQTKAGKCRCSQKTGQPKQQKLFNQSQLPPANWFVCRTCNRPWSLSVTALWPACDVLIHLFSFLLFSWIIVQLRRAGLFFSIFAVCACWEVGWGEMVRIVLLAKLVSCACVYLTFLCSVWM